MNSTLVIFVSLFTLHISVNTHIIHFLSVLPTTRYYHWYLTTLLSYFSNQSIQTQKKCLTEKKGRQGDKKLSDYHRSNEAFKLRIASSLINSCFHASLATGWQTASRLPNQLCGAYCLCHTKKPSKFRASAVLNALQGYQEFYTIQFSQN